MITMMREAFRENENIQVRLAHELGGRLWSLLVIALLTETNFAIAFVQTMAEHKERIAS